MSSLCSRVADVMVIRLAGESMRSLLFAEVEVEVEAEIKAGLTRAMKNDQALFSRSVARSRYLTQDGFSVASAVLQVQATICSARIRPHSWDG
jgi:hypothetical protein